jgi:hypothetical protein
MQTKLTPTTKSKRLNKDLFWIDERQIHRQQPPELEKRILWLKLLRYISNEKIINDDNHF